MDKKGASALDRSSAAGSKHPHSYGYMGPHVLTVALPACSAMIPHLSPELWENSGETLQKIAVL